MQPNPEEVSDSQEKAKAAYDEATKIAGQELSTTDPIRLGLALNYSVFHYEILKNSEEACEIAKTAFDSAIQELDNVDEETYKVIQLASSYFQAMLPINVLFKLVWIGAEVCAVYW